METATIPGVEIANIPELRIGNFVLFKGEIAKVDGVFRSIYRTDTFGFYIKDERGPKYTDIKFIPLTPGLLEKCGGQAGGSSWYDFEIGGNSWSVNLETEECLITHSFGEEGVMLPFPEYLHTFQNLIYALTTEELEINL